jgi:guanylate cyclase
MTNRDSVARLAGRESVPGLGTRPPLLRKLYRALDAHDIDGDRTEPRIVRRLQLGMALGSIPLIAGLAGIYLAGGHTSCAAWCFAYVAATAALVGALAITGRFAVFRVPHVVCVAVLPTALTIWLGGFAQAGGAAMWTLIVPIGAMMFGFRHRALWFVGAALAAVTIALTRRPEAAELSPSELNFHFAFNTIGFIGFLFASVSYFMSRIEQENARAEGLLVQVLPEPIVRRLKRGQQVADHVDAVTVVFADIVGFTPLAARLAPTEVVDLLDEIFRRFDDLATKHGVEKIKTIGDAYMAVAGAPEHCDDHAARAARLALAMRDAVRELAASRNIELSMRIGLHTGEVVAGVIGAQRFAYDLWGDTVNTASRMESHGQPGEIQLTAATRAALGDAFRTRERGEIDVKGRGRVATHWLDG